MDIEIDDNNNASAEKSYSLRPRASVKVDKDDEGDEETWRPRGRSRKRQKQMSAPLSKYRRKTANARERSRMREINDAFESLRRAIPHLASCEPTSEKVSKIMTLRLAMKYITALSNALEDPEAYSLDTSSTASSASDHVTWGDQLFLDHPSSATPLAVDAQDSFSHFFAKTCLSGFSEPPVHPPRLTHTPPEDPVVHPSLTTSSLFPVPDFDGLPSPVIDFCDLFIT